MEALRRPEAPRKEMRRQPTPWEQYERFKERLRAQNLHPDEYERRIQKYAKVLGI